MRYAIRYLSVLIAAASPLTAQQSQGSPPAAARKPVLKSADYAKWETLGNGVLSPDGKWIAYDLRRGDGSGELRYHAIDTVAEHSARLGINPQFTSNSRWLLYTVTPDTVGGARAGRGGRGGPAGTATATATPPRNKVAAVDLRTGVTTTFVVRVVAPTEDHGVVPAELAGTFKAGTVSLLEFWNTHTREYVGRNGYLAFFTFDVDGTYKLLVYTLMRAP